MINTIDTNLYNIMFKLFSTKTTFAMTFISHLGSATTLILLSILFFITFKNKKTSLIISINLILVYLLNVMVKVIVGRERPEVLRLVLEDGYSFPSGHAMVSTGFYGLLIYITYKKIKNKTIRNLIIAILSLLIILIGLSRIYLGAHYATDVLGGFIIGTIYLIIFIKIMGRKKLWEKPL